MNKIFYLFFLVYGQFAIAQNPEYINKIKFIYSIDGSSFGDKGIYSKSEILELIRVTNDEFKILSHLKIADIFKNRTIVSDTIDISTRNYPTISQDDIRNLFNELNLNKENLSKEFLSPYLKKLTENQILKIAKLAKSESYFINNYDKKKDLKKKYDEIQNLKYFDEFIESTKPDLNTFPLYMHSWNFLQISAEPSSDEKSYQMTFFENVGQPIQIIKSNMGKIPEQNINLNVNLLVQKILPKESYSHKMVDLNRILENYIFWFLKNKKTELKY